MAESPLPILRNSIYINGGTPYVVNSNDDMINIDTTIGGSTIVWLPQLSIGCDTNRKIYVNDYKGNAQNNPIVLTAIGGNLVNGASTFTLGINNISAEIIITGTSEYLVSINSDSGSVPGAYLPLAGGTMSGDIAMSGNNISNLNFIKDSTGTYPSIAPNSRTLNYPYDGTSSVQALIWDNILNGVGISSTDPTQGIAYLKTTNLTGSDRTFEFPNASGTIALSSDLSLYVKVDGTTPMTADWNAGGFSIYNFTYSDASNNKILQGRTFFESGGNEVADFQNSNLTNGNKVSINWGNHTLCVPDTDNTANLDWGNRVLSNTYWTTVGNFGVGTNTTAPTSILHIVNTATSTIRGVLNDQYSSDTLSAKFYARKARGTFASPTTIVTGDVIANWTSAAYDGTSFVDSADMRVLSTGTISTGIVPSQIVFRTTSSSGTLTQALTVSEKQFIGIGTSSPSALLHINSNVSSAYWGPSSIGILVGNNTYTDISSSGTVSGINIHTLGQPTLASSNSVTYTNYNGLFLANPLTGTNVTSTNTWALATGGNINFNGGSSLSKINSTSNLTLQTASTDRFIISSGGLTSIGTTTPAALLDINGNALALSATAWTTTGIGLRMRAMTFTDTTSSGTVVSQFINVISTPTIAASSTTTYTLSATLNINGPSAGTNVTQSNTAALRLTDNLYFQSGGSVVLGTFDAQSLLIRTNNITKYTITSAGSHSFTSSAFTGTTTFMSMSPGTSSSGTSTGLLWTGAPHTGQTASTELIDINFALNRTIQWATGALTTQRFFLIQAPTISFAGSSTVTQAATFAISGAPIAGSNATLTETNAFWVQGGQSRFDGAIKIIDQNFILSTVTGTKLGTATSQKLSFWNATPVVQPTTAITGAVITANSGTAVNDASTFSGYTVGQVVAALRQIGILA